MQKSSGIKAYNKRKKLK